MNKAGSLSDTPGGQHEAGARLSRCPTAPPSLGHLMNGPHDDWGPTAYIIPLHSIPRTPFLFFIFFSFFQSINSLLPPSFNSCLVPLPFLFICARGGAHPPRVLRPISSLSLSVPPYHPFFHSPALLPQYPPPTSSSRLAYRDCPIAISGTHRARAVA